jgi:alanyl-tRNA synthetase
MKHKNLISLASRTKKEQRKIAQKGGIASGRTRLAISYNDDAIKVIDLTFEIEREQQKPLYINKYITLKRDDEKIKEMQKELKKYQLRADTKAKKYKDKYKSEIDDDIEKIINRLNRKYDKHIRKVKGGINENNNDSK